MKIIFVLIVLAGVAVVLYFDFFNREKGETVDHQNKPLNYSEKTTNEVLPTENYVIEQLPIESGVGMESPDLNRKVNFSQGINFDDKILIETKIEEVKALIKENSLAYEPWMNLATYLKMAGDLEGAGIIWEYVGILYPKNSTSFTNLGNLYGYYLNDIKKAEINYFKSIENDPNFSNLYLRLADFYREVVGDLEKAKNILIKGLAVLPQDPSLLGSLEYVNSLLRERSLSPVPM